MKVISVGIEGKNLSRRRQHDVLVLFPDFLVHESLKILEKYITNFFKGYITYLRTDQTGSQVHLI